MPSKTKQRSELQRIMTRPEVKRNQVRAAVVAELQKLFPIEATKYVIDVSNIRVVERLYASGDQKNAILDGRSLFEPVKADVVLKDKATGQEIQRKANFTLMQLPWMTPRHTFTIDGNEYSIANQPRIKPGVYTRTRSNEEIESAFNLAKGKNFRLSLQPDSGKFYFELGTTKIPLYNVLRALGVKPSAIDEAWGRELANINGSAFTKAYEKSVNALYKKLIPRAKAGLSFDKKLEAVKEYFAATKMDPEVNKTTLGAALDTVSTDALLRASRKLLKVYNEEEKEDDRDSLEFKKMHSVEDHFAERVRLKGRDTVHRIKFKMNFSKGAPELSRFMPVGSFSKVIRSFVTTATLSAQPTQINPVEIIDYAVKVTPLGEGGIENERAIPDEARETHATHFGILDTIRTPESSHAGVDVRAAMLSSKDKDGNMYTPMYNLRNGELEHVSAGAISRSVVAFPMQGLKAHSKLSKAELERMVDVLEGGEVKKRAVKDVDYYLDHPAKMYGPSTNLIPALDGIQGNRAIMGSKMMGQAVPLKDAEAPLVQAASYVKGRSHEQVMADMVNPTSPVAGTVKEVNKDFVVIDGDDGKEHKVTYYDHFPLASKTYLHDKPIVKPGDKVKKGDHVAESIYTRNKTLALGKNLDVAYLAYKGLNSNDAVVISETAAKKLTSLHMYKHVLPLDKQITLNKNKFAAQYPTAYSVDQLKKLDDEGVVTVGTKLEAGDPWIVALRKTEPSAEDRMLGRLHRGLIRQFRDESKTWDRDYPGEVTDVSRTSRKVTITVRVEAPMKVGDKVSNRYGGKGVVSKVVPDDQMPQRETGKPIDMLITSASVVSRINPAQIVETSIAKVMEKKGKPYVFQNFGKIKNGVLARNMLNEAGIPDKERVYDPVEKKWIKDVFVGPQYTLKLFKSTDTNFSARDIGGYDPHQQPGHGGVEGAKTLGGMEVNALLAHSARGLLQEASVIKSQKNSDFWRATQLGLPTPPPKPTFAYKKFMAMLNGAGVNVTREGNKMVMAPLTDADVERMSSGAIDNPRMVRAKDLYPERGGLFDEVITGGSRGERWSHIEMAEPVVNPMFEEPARRLLRMKQAEFRDLMVKEGGEVVRKRLNALDLDAEEKSWRKQLKGAKGTQRNDAVKALKYIRSLKRVNKKAGDAYVLSKIPVLPPVMRPITPSKSGDLMIDDPNYLYRDVMLATDAVQQAVEADLPDEDVASARAHTYESMKALVGLADPVSPQLAAKNVQGFIKNIAGRNPKNGFFQSKLVSRPQDLTGRGTAAPDPSLGLDEIGIPKEMAWKMYSSFIVRRLVRSGYTAARAKELLDNKALPAQQALEAEIKERPVLYNRAPSLWRYSVVAAYPKLIKGKTLKVNPLVESGMNLDYDGDALQLHLPATDKGVRDAQKMTLSNLLFSDKARNDLLVFPQHEAIIGIYQATMAKPTGKKKKFKSKADAWQAYRDGKLELGDEVLIG